MTHAVMCSAHDDVGHGCFVPWCTCHCHNAIPISTSSRVKPMSDTRDPLHDQQVPVPNDEVSTYDLVMKDIEERRQHGRRKYGVAHQPFNSRDNLLDAYQECLDLCIYLRAELEERSRR